MTTTVEVVEEIEGFKAPQRIRRREQNHYFLCHLTGVVLCCCCSEEFDDDDRNEQIIPHHQFSNRCCGRFSFSLASRFLLNESWSNTNCRLTRKSRIKRFLRFRGRILRVISIDFCHIFNGRQMDLSTLIKPQNIAHYFIRRQKYFNPFGGNCTAF